VSLFTSNSCSSGAGAMTSGASRGALLSVELRAPRLGDRVFCATCVPPMSLLCPSYVPPMSLLCPSYVPPMSLLCPSSYVPPLSHPMSLLQRRGQERGRKGVAASLLSPQPQRRESFSLTRESSLVLSSRRSRHLERASSWGNRDLRSVPVCSRAWSAHPAELGVLMHAACIASARCRAWSAHPAACIASNAHWRWGNCDLRSVPVCSRAWGAHA